MQRVFMVDEKEESGVYRKATKGAAKGEAGVPYKGRSTARMEEKFGRRIEEKSRETLWQRSARGSISTGVRMVHRESNSDVCVV